MTTTIPPVHLAGSVLDRARHVCAFFIVMDIMRTHPMVIIGGLLQENPFFVPPDQMLPELQRRKRPGSR